MTYFSSVATETNSIFFPLAAKYFWGVFMDQRTVRTREKRIFTKIPAKISSSNPRTFSPLQGLADATSLGQDTTSHCHSALRREQQLQLLAANTWESAPGLT